MVKRRALPRIAAVAAGLTLLLSACASDGDGGADMPAGSGQPKPAATAAAESPSPAAVLASARGSSPDTNGVVIDVTSLRRIAADTVTLVATIRNQGSQELSYLALSSSGADYMRPSASGVTLIDFAGKLRYYPLRDTEKRCVCTPFSLVGGLPAGGETQVTVSFPAPPADVRSVVVDWTGFTPTPEVSLS